MYVHVPVEALEARPWLGVLIGGAGALLFAALCVTSALEGRALALSGGPHTVDAATLSALMADRPDHRWVTLHRIAWRCDHVEYRERPLPERWVFGHIADTLVGVGDASGQIVLVAKLEGQAPCPGPPSATGVAVREGDRGWGAHVPRALRERVVRRPATVLVVGAGPQEARDLALGFAAFGAACAAFASWWARRWIRMRRARAAARDAAWARGSGQPPPPIVP